MALKRIITGPSNPFMKINQINNCMLSRLPTLHLSHLPPFGHISKRLCTAEQALDFDASKPTTFSNRFRARDSEGKVKLMVGDYTTYDKTFTASLIATYSKLTGNFNPLHDTNDNSAARRAGFEASIIHGMFTTSIFSAAIGAHLLCIYYKI